MKEDFAQHVLFDAGRRRTRLGSVKKREEVEPSQDDTDQPLLLAPKILPFPKNWNYISFQFPLRSSYVFPRPFET
ncbi:hypothetical protein GIB67_037674 [Kingdonia uniflora]|uniref:Uncharacterized protein n=1 Tax=Kingdonia uniflora TaxID=39325 RepID=A0A7J7L743_9MAGN|nr:hypothetical protein GIB67_037674 [Kingdonia uniflora]